MWPLNKKHSPVDHAKTAVPQEWWRILSCIGQSWQREHLGGAGGQTSLRKPYCKSFENITPDRDQRRMLRLNHQPLLSEFRLQIQNILKGETSKAHHHSSKHQNDTSKWPRLGPPHSTLDQELGRIERPELLANAPATQDWQSARTTSASPRRVTQSKPLLAPIRRVLLRQQAGPNNRGDTNLLYSWDSTNL